MLVLTRKKGQSIVIGDNIEVTIVESQGDQVRIGINAPKSISVHRKEVYEEIQKENQNAAVFDISSVKELIKKGIKKSDKNKVE